VVAVVGVLGLAGALLSPGLDGSRTSSRGDVCKANLRWQSEGYASYANDYRGQIASYSWRAGFEYGNEFVQLSSPPDSDSTATSWQQTEILRRHTGRVDGEFQIRNNLLSIPQRRFNHLPLLDYLGSLTPQMVMACPEDANLIASKLDPLDESLWADTSQYNQSNIFANSRVRQRYPFSSTYQTVPNAIWHDGMFRANAFVRPIASTSHLLTSLGVDDQVGTRKIEEIRFPDRKVYLFEQNDFHRSEGDPFYAYEQARCNQLFFDGSVGDARSGSAELGWDPGDPDSTDTFMYQYTPLSTEPIPIGDPNTLLPVRYRFTRLGLKGFDYAVRTDPSPGPESGPNPWP